LQTTQPYAGVNTEELPRALSRWNWGAFLLNGIWSIGNRCHFGLLTFVPFFGLIVPFVLGAKGNMWAWKAGNWQSLEHFQCAQRRWTRMALIAYAGAAIIVTGLFFLLTAQMRRSPAFEMAYAELTRSALVTEVLGTPIEAGTVTGSIKASFNGSGGADLGFGVHGPRNKGKAYVRANQYAGEWKIEDLTLVLQDGRRLELQEQPVQSATDSSPTPSTPEPPAPIPTTAPPLLPTMRVHLTNEQISVRGALSREAVEEALASQRGALEQCLEQAAGAAKLGLKLVVAPNGTVQRASVERARGIDARARACVLEAARSFRLPAPSRGSAVVKQTISIAP
jgi:hypothetical protein